MMGIEIFTSIADAAATWHAAERECILYGFQSFAWLSTWQETIGAFEGIEPYIVRVIDKAGGTAMLLPLGIQRRAGCRVLNFLGGGLTDYNAPILKAGFAPRGGTAGFHALWEEILRRLPPVDIVRLERMPETIHGLENPLVSLSGVRRGIDSFWTVLEGDFGEFQRRRSSNLRRDTLRKRRRLAEVGTVSFRIARTPHEAKAYFAAIARQKTHRYRETGRSDLFEIPAYRDFYSRMAADQCRSGLIHVSALCVDGEIVAGHWGMVHRGRFYWLMPAYAGGSWAKYSTGRLLLDHLVEWGFDNRIEVFDFTGGDEAYKFQWCDRKMALFELEQPRSIKGILPALNSRLKAGMKEQIERKPRLHETVKRTRRQLARLRFLRTYSIAMVMSLVA